MIPIVLSNTNNLQVPDNTAQSTRAVEYIDCISAEE